MSDVIELELPSGAIVTAETAGGGGGFRPMAPGQPVRRKLIEVAEELASALGVIAGRLEALAPRQPDTIALETHVEIGSGGAIKLLAADVKGGLKVTLTWSAASGSKSKGA